MEHTITPTLAQLTEELARVKAQIKTLNSRIALDAKSYERDQYLIAALRKQLAEASK